MANRKPYPSDVSDEEWGFVAPYLALVREDAPQREHDLREVFDGLRWMVRTGSAWRYMPHDLPPWEAVYQQTQRWLKAGVFEAMVHDLRVILRLSEGRAKEPTAAILDSRTLGSTPESGSLSGRLGRSETQERLEGTRGGGHLGAPARLARKPGQRAGTGSGGRLGEGRARSDRRIGGVGVCGSRLHRWGAAEKAEAYAIHLEVVKHEEAKRGFVLLPRRWVVERDFAWASRFGRLVKDYERLPDTLAGLHFVAFACLFLQQATGILGAGS